MRTDPFPFVAAILILASFVGAQGDLPEARKAFDRGDYESAEKLLKPVLTDTRAVLEAWRLGARVAWRLGDWETARRRADRVLAERPKDRTMRNVRAKTVIREARQLQRIHGYGAALAVLEPEVGDLDVAQRYADTVVWAGQEKRGLDVVERTALTKEQKAWLKSIIYWRRGRFAEAVAVLREAGLGNQEWVRNYAAEAELRARLGARGRRALWLAVIAALLLFGGGAVLIRKGRAAEPA